MKTLKYLISIVVAVVLLVSCHKTPKTADYRDQWRMSPTETGVWRGSSMLTKPMTDM